MREPGLYTGHPLNDTERERGMNLKAVCLIFDDTQQSLILYSLHGR